MHNTDYRRIKRSSIHLTSNQAIKVNFRRSKILIPVANGSTGLVSVTTPWLATGNETAFGSYGSIFVSLVIRCIKMFRLVVVVDLNRKKSTQLCSS